LKGKRILITGGAGFVGSHTADALIEAGHEVCIYDNLTSQVHSGGETYIPNGANFVLGDVRDLAKLSSVVRDAEVIFHLAAAVGVGQSMYCISDYTSTNNLGTANLLQAVLDTRCTPEKNRGCLFDVNLWRREVSVRGVRRGCATATSG